MDREELKQLESLIEKYVEKYGDDVSNDRYSALKVAHDTVTATIVGGCYEKI